jgi:hypothetical protein
MDRGRKNGGEGLEVCFVLRREVQTTDTRESLSKKNQIPAPPRIPCARAKSLARVLPH